MAKRVFIQLTGLIFLLFNLSCSKEKINEATEFDINYSTEIDVPESSISVTAPADYTTPEIQTQSSSRFASEKTAADLVDEIQLTRFVLSNPSGNLDYLKSVSIFIKAQGVNEVLVATKSNIPAGSTTVAADLTGANIKEHIVKEKIQFRLSVTISTGLSNDQKLKVDQTVKVKGKRVK